MLTIPNERKKITPIELDKIKNEIEKTISHFSYKDPKQGARIYFELRIGRMLSPFPKLLHYLYQSTNSSKEVNRKIKSYLSSKPSLYLDGFFSMLKAYSSQSIELDQLSNRIAHFSILIREFAYLYGTANDHYNEFGNNPYRTNMDYFYEKGNLIAANLLHFLADQATASSIEELEILADYYIRENLFTAYTLSGIDGTIEERLTDHRKRYTQVKNSIKRLNEISTGAIPLLENLIQKNNVTDPFELSLINYYQIAMEPKSSDLDKVPFLMNNALMRQTGFELEFNSGSNGLQLEALAIKYQKLLNWKNLHTRPSKNMYDSTSDGLLYYDATLPQRLDAQGTAIGCPLEYSAPPFTFREDGDKYTCFLNMIKKEEESILYPNSETHQHIYAEDIDLDGLKRLVLRRAWLDQSLLAAFHVPEKRHDLNRSAGALLTNISSHTTEQERIKNYIIFSGIVNSAQNKNVLTQRVNRGSSKYNSLNLVPRKTIEFRGMQGTFSKPFLEFYLKFNLFFVESAIQNSPIHYLPNGIQQAERLREADESPVLPSKRIRYHREAFDPMKHLSLNQKNLLLNYDKHVTPELIRSEGELPPDPLRIGIHQIVENIK